MSLFSSTMGHSVPEVNMCQVQWLRFGVFVHPILLQPRLTRTMKHEPRRKIFG
jgi:hypothetical protein